FLGLMAAAAQSWRHLAWLVAIAGTVPVVYQLWRMSYYALPYPLTAVAKDAGGSKWGRGLEYLWDLLSPYVLLLPLAAVLVAGLVCLWAVANPVSAWRDRRASWGRDEAAGRDENDDAAATDDTAIGTVFSRLGLLRGRVRSTPVVTVVFLVVA